MSGDLKGDDGANFTNNAENAYHVVISAGNVGTAELNGFTISGGGNAIDDRYSSDVIVNGQYIYQTLGGGIYILYSSPLFSYITLSGNNTSWSGGGIYNEEASPVLSNVVISGNKSEVGAGMSSYSSVFPVLINVTITGNTVEYSSELIRGQDDVIIIYNSIIFEKMYQDYGVITMATNSLISGGATGTGNINASNYTAEQIFTNPAAGDYTLKTGSPAINTSSNALYMPYFGNITTDKDLAGNPRLDGTIIDMGTYENQQSALPVTLISFTASTQGENSALLQWLTASELNSKGFEIKMLRTDKTYQKTAFVQGNGTTDKEHHYQTVVSNLLPGMYYFRLKMIDTDDSFTYSTLRSVKVTDGLELAVKMYPNPVTGRYVYMEMPGNTAKKANIKITNNLGQVLISAEYTDITGPLKIEMPVAAGVYYIEVTTADATTFVRKVVRL